ncbi:MAG: guanylate kinase [Clostridia bacterium]|nr:guanylate kinase [Clostridia bacterium]MBQ4245207.1 guanylate kinase [Clostridia bacterium]
MSDKGLLIVLSGPSGVGKDTVLRHVESENEDVNVSVSLTTREMREGEINGKSYYFVERGYFERKLGEDAFLEYAEYGGNLYGTPKAPVDAMLARGDNVILEIEVQGAEKIRKLYPDCVSIFILPPSLSVLESRLRGRSSDDEETILRRLLIAREEIKRCVEYDYIVINDDVRKAVDEVVGIIRAEALRTDRNKQKIKEVLNNE